MCSYQCVSFSLNAFVCVTSFCGFTDRRNHKVCQSSESVYVYGPTCESVSFLDVSKCVSVCACVKTFTGNLLEPPQMTVHSLNTFSAACKWWPPDRAMEAQTYRICFRFSDVNQTFFIHWNFGSSTAHDRRTWAIDQWGGTCFSKRINAHNDKYTVAVIWQIKCHHVTWCHVSWWIQWIKRDCVFW